MANAPGNARYANFTRNSPTFDEIVKMYSGKFAQKSPRSPRFTHRRRRFSTSNIPRIRPPLNAHPQLRRELRRSKRLAGQRISYKSMLTRYASKRPKTRKHHNKSHGN